MHVQIVKFKLKPDADREHFLSLTLEMISWLKEREGFEAYELYEESEYWFDRIAWATKKHAHEGTALFRKTPIAQQIIALVENGYISFFGEKVLST